MTHPAFSSAGTHWKPSGKRALWASMLALLAVVFSGCSHTMLREPAPFQLEDFKFEIEEKEHNVTYKGRGVLKAQSPEMENGNYFLFLRVRHKDSLQVASEMVAVILTRGAGELNFTIFYGKSQKPAKPPEFVWEIIGYIPLLPGTLSQN